MKRRRRRRRRKSIRRWRKVRIESGKVVTRRCAMGVPFVEPPPVVEVVRNNVEDYCYYPYYPRIATDLKSIESRRHLALSTFPKTCPILWIVFTIHLILIGALGTKILDGTGGIEVEINVPNEAKIGSAIELECQWQVYGANGLYSVKWYKDEHEFFRYVPDDNPRIQTFSQPGIHVDNGWNNEKSIRLKDLETRSSGQYKCEVSTEAPSFATVYRTANLTVIAMPERGPEITGLPSRYTIGEDVTANCTVWPSVPKAFIHWLINGKPIATERMIQYLETKVENNAKTEAKEKEKEKETDEERKSTVGVRVKLEPGYFAITEDMSTIVIKCIAQIGSSQLETEKRVPMVHQPHNQRLSANDAVNEAHAIERLSLIFLSYLCSFL